MLSDKSVLELLPYEQFFRAYIGFTWFYATAPPADAISQLQHGVNRTIDAMPVLSGVLREDPTSNRAYVAYDTGSTVSVQQIHVDYTYAELSSTGFDQNRFRELFRNQQMELSQMPSIDNVPVLQVQASWLRDGGWAVGILCHHVLADASATLLVAQSISRASRDLDPLYLAASRNILTHAMLMHEPQAIPSTEHVRQTVKGQRISSILADPAQLLMRRRQIRITGDSIARLKADGRGNTTNTLVMALLWRAWARMLGQRGSRDAYAYLGWPIDMRVAREYLGNQFLPYLGHATMRFVLDEPLWTVADLLLRMTQSASVAQLRAFHDSAVAGEPDVRALLETSDSPALSFSNMTRLQLHDIEGFGGCTGKPGAVQMLAIDAPMMMFAITDGAGGMLVNVMLPDHIADAFAADPELAQYASLHAASQQRWKIQTTARLFNGGGLAKVYSDLSKDKLTGFVVLTAMAGYAVAPGATHLGTLLWMTGGTTLCAASANTLNQWIEVPYDAQMSRTRNRPLARHALAPHHALGFGAGAGIAGVTALWVFVNPTAAALGAANIALYAGAYTAMKRLTIANTWVGSLVGAVPPLMGWAAATGGALGPGAWVLAAMMFAWQFPHFNSLAYTLRADYSKAGYRMMSVTHPRLNARVALRYALLMFPLSAALVATGTTDAWFMADSSLVNGLMAYCAYAFWRNPDARRSRRLFFSSLVHLPVLMILIMVHKLLQDRRKRTLTQLQSEPQ
ncbi:Protoheme IX farnesyltransferase, mitochondrial [Coemansia sp. RSA 1933]|nr:Protoheme IX farnesyltransferase, mitochondrial [Coemansia sp. RSA 1933]